MLNPSMFSKLNYSTKQTSSGGKTIQIDKLSGYTRTRWDQQIQVPSILYQKFKINPPTASRSSQINQVNNHNYPPTLIDFVRRAYHRCKDNAQSKKMESQIRQIIEKNKANLEAVNWENFPIPNVSVSTLTENSRPVPNSNVHQYSNTFAPGGFGNTNIGSKLPQKQSFILPSSIYNQSLIDKIEKPNTQSQSKTKQLINRKLQMFQQKYEQQRTLPQVKTQQHEQKKFIGFKDEKQVRLQMLKQKYQQMHQKNKIQQQIKPEAPKSQIQSMNSFNTAVSGSLNGNSSKISSKDTSKGSKNSQPLSVVESKVPEKVYEVRKIPQSLKAQQKKQPVKTQKITKKQLQTIVKAGQQQDLKTVAKRFTQFNKIKSVKQVQVSEQAEQEDLDFKIVGKCKNIDKPYLRITHRPDPQTVRPESILRKAFNHYKNQYKKGVSYDLIISQLRSIRQDLVVQDIKNSFTVQVYEQNLKISLFQDDPIQMKQCQTNLWQLYRQGLYNKRADRTKFISYHFICMILQQRYKELQYMLTLIPSEVLQQKQIQQSLNLKRHLVIGNYHAFFKFYGSQDQTCQKLMNNYIDKVRVKCLVMICKTFGEKISFKLLEDNTGEDQDILQTLAKEQGAIISDGNLMLKQSYQVLKNSEYLQVKKVTSLLD